MNVLTVAGGRTEQLCQGLVIIITISHRSITILPSSPHVFFPSDGEIQPYSAP